MCKHFNKISRCISILPYIRYFSFHLDKYRLKSLTTFFKLHTKKKNQKIISQTDCNKNRDGRTAEQGTNDKTVISRQCNYISRPRKGSNSGESSGVAAP